LKSLAGVCALQGAWWVSPAMLLMFQLPYFIANTLCKLLAEKGCYYLLELMCWGSHWILDSQCGSVPELVWLKIHSGKYCALQNPLISHNMPVKFTSTLSSITGTRSNVLVLSHCKSTKCWYLSHLGMLSSSLGPCKSCKSKRGTAIQFVNLKHLNNSWEPHSFLYYLVNPFSFLLPLVTMSCSFALLSSFCYLRSSFFLFLKLSFPHN
jgi:hypothetical protein